MPSEISIINTHRTCEIKDEQNNHKMCGFQTNKMLVMLANQKSMNYSVLGIKKKDVLQKLGFFQWEETEILTPKKISFLGSLGRVMWRLTSGFFNLSLKRKMHGY